MANKLYAMEQLTEEVAKDVAASPQEWMRFLDTALRRIIIPEALTVALPTIGNLESEDVPLDQKGSQGDCLD